MSINYNTSWLNGSYENDAFHFIGWFENPALMTASGANLAAHLAAHFEGTSIAIGFGYDLIQNRRTAQSALAAVGVTITNEQMTLLNQAAAAGSTTPEGLALRQTIATQLATGGVVLPSRTAAENLFQNIRRNDYEGRLDSALSNNGFTGTLIESRERLALLSLIYAGRLTDRGSASSPERNTLTGIAQGLQEENRQEVWFWIRYRSNYAGNPEDEARNKGGYTTRAYAESELFGIFNNENSATPDEAKNIYKILQAHRDEIFTFEKTWGTDPNASDNITPTKRIAAANRIYQLTGDYEVKTIATEFNPAKDALFEYLKGRTDLPELLKNRLTDYNIASTNIYLNSDTDPSSTLDSLKYETGAYINGANDLMIGMDQEDYICGNKGDDVLIGEAGNDFLWGGEGRDVLYGGEGNDFLWGDEGNDTMYGGLDDDIYFISPGDGEDRIEDKHGNNKIVFCFKEINFFYEIDEGQYKSLDGSLTGEMLNGELHVTLDGATNTKVILNENFQWGDFGITLIDLPDDIPALPDFGPLYALSGDLTPIDMDPIEPGVQYGYDQWGNVIVDPDLPDPGRGDVLYDTIGSDKIEGLGGNDTIYVTRGNGDWVLGGAGNDTIDIQASGNILVEGGSGNDYIETTADNLFNARIYGDTGDDMIMMDSNGSGWVYGGEGSDLIDGERLNNCRVMTRTAGFL